MKTKISAKALVCRIFALLILLILLIGIVTTLFFPDEINYYENRYANKVPEFGYSAFLDGTYQDGVEDALSDQVQLALTAKKAYNDSCAKLSKAVIDLLVSHSDQYIIYKNVIFYKDKILYNTQSMEKIQSAFDAKIKDLNSAFEKYPQLDFYMYYIEKDTDIDFRTNEKIGAYEYLKANINLPDSRFSRFEINSFDEFADYFYSTDHHWNYKGSYKGYSEVISMLGGTPLIPADTVSPGYRFAGSKARDLGGLYTDEMTIYRFDLPKMSITIDGKPSDDYGCQDEYAAGKVPKPSYGLVYGTDSGEIIFDTHTEGENLLVIGESYDNAILKLLASHFSKTYSVDLRNYEPLLGRPFDFSSYVKEHNIDKVLLIGNIDYYIMQEFMLKG